MGLHGEGTMMHRNQKTGVNGQSSSKDWLIGNSRLLSRVLSGTNPSVKCGDPVLDQELPLPEGDDKMYTDFDPSRWY